jgi:hypothetical protein
MSMMLVYVLLLSSAFALRFLSGKWQQIALLEPPVIPV